VPTAAAATVVEASRDGSVRRGMFDGVRDGGDGDGDGNVDDDVRDGILNDGGCFAVAPFPTEEGFGSWLEMVTLLQTKEAATRVTHPPSRRLLWSREVRPLLSPAPVRDGGCTWLWGFFLLFFFDKLDKLSLPLWFCDSRVTDKKLRSV